MREVTVETFLYDGIVALDGLCIKIPPAARNHQPDRLILLQFVVPHCIETKAPGKEARDGQKREHARYAARNMPVYVLNTRDKVRHHLHGLGLMHHYYREYNGTFDSAHLIARCPDNLSY